MTTSGAKPMPVLGFLTVIEHEQHGLLGGYLVLNHAGRPLEFHCTSGVKPNRAQEILFGPTLSSYLYGEQIGQTLVSKSSLAPQLICTNHAQALAVRDYVQSPVVLVERDATDTDRTYRVDAAHSGPLAQLVRKRGADRILLANDRQGDRELVEASLSALADSFELSEPFARILSAIEEAQRGAK
jgi:hypothetical protein